MLKDTHVGAVSSQIFVHYTSWEKSLVWLVASGEFAALLKELLFASASGTHTSEVTVCSQRLSCPLLSNSFNSLHRAFMMCLSVKNFVYAAHSKIITLNVCVCFEKLHANVEIARRVFFWAGENSPPMTVLSAFGIAGFSEFEKAASLLRGRVPSLWLLKAGFSKRLNSCPYLSQRLVWTRTWLSYQLWHLPGTNISSSDNLCSSPRSALTPAGWHFSFLGGFWCI